MKKIFIASTFIFLGVFLFYLYQRSGNHSVSSQEPWVTFKKTSPQKIDSYPTTPAEKEDAKIHNDNKVTQAPQSKANRKPATKTPLLKPKGPTSIPGRQWNLYPDQELPEKISFKNKVNDNWKALMGQDVMRFLRPETKLFVKKQKSLTLLERDGGLHVEQVYIKMISPEGRHFSYQAFVDSENGKIVKTWNRTIHEPMGKDTPKFKATGTIGPDGSQQF